jgi:hypothetical protein
MGKGRGTAEAVAQGARKTLAGLPERILEGILRDRVHASVLHVLAREERKTVSTGLAAGTVPAPRAMAAATSSGFVTWGGT